MNPINMDSPQGAALIAAGMVIAVRGSGLDIIGRVAYRAKNRSYEPFFTPAPGNDKLPIEALRILPEVQDALHHIFDPTAERVTNTPIATLLQYLVDDVFEEKDRILKSEPVQLIED